MGNEALQAGLLVGSVVSNGIAQWKQIQLERQQDRELQAGIGLYTQRTQAARQGANYQDHREVSNYQAQIKRNPNSTIASRPTGGVLEDGSVEEEMVVRTPEGDIPIEQMMQMQARAQQTDDSVALADLDALFELQARYPNNPKVKQFVASTYSGIQAKQELRYKQQQQQLVLLERYQAQQRYELDQQKFGLEREQLAEQQRQFDAGPERDRAKETFQTDERIRGDLTIAQGKAQIEAQNKPQKPATEFVKKLQQMAPRAQAALEELDKLDVDRAGLAQGAQSLLPNALRGSQRQQIDQAANQFINSVLRAESGATITDSEIEKAKRQYIPQLGDSPEVIQQKRQARQTAVQELYRAAELEAPAAGARDRQQPRTPEEVRAAFKAGKISREQAVSMIKGMGRGR